MSTTPLKSPQLVSDGKRWWFTVSDRLGVLAEGWYEEFNEKVRALAGDVEDGDEWEITWERR